MKKILNGRLFYVGLIAVSCLVGVITYNTMSNKLANDIKQSKIEIPQTQEIEQKPTPPKAEQTTKQVEYQQKQPTPEKTPKAEAKVYFYMPVNGTIIKEYNPETLVFSSTMGDYRAHMGVDISAAAGTQVMAMASGTISNIVDDDLMGVTVTIEHDNDIVSVYSGLSTEIPDGITVGTHVDAQTVIGGVSDTIPCESSDPTHLHFEVLKAGENIDPFSLIKG